MKFRRVWDEVEAIQFTGDNHEEVGIFTDNAFQVDENCIPYVIDAKEGTHVDVFLGDYIIKDPDYPGGFFLMEPEHFEPFFEEVK